MLELSTNRSKLTSENQPEKGKQSTQGTKGERKYIYLTESVGDRGKAKGWKSWIQRNRGAGEGFLILFHNRGLKGKVE